MRKSGSGANDPHTVSYIDIYTMRCSSELWVLEQGVAYCHNHTCVGGYLDLRKSSTYQVLKQGGFNNTYGLGKNASGDITTDTISIGTAQVHNQRFSVVNSTTELLGIMGAGCRINEADCALHGVSNCQTYPTSIDDIVEQGVISSAAYSMYLNNTVDATGSVL
ncbi:hypothetical protein AMS68_007265 [Peltaster fructicola]|uniref:Peptidase A1 domain-containing protein n=1 Tax=Peltaster fructicola TaxID=286661 RepID=A0A6H0Y4I1_9PEZI|nr:hypothetical protein AMS68_007265 [Peltaster fructicola]